MVQGVKKVIAERLFIIAGSYESLLYGWEILKSSDGGLNPKLVFRCEVHLEAIKCLSVCGKLLATGSNDELVKIYDIEVQNELGTLDHHTDSITDLLFFQNKFLFTSSLDGTIAIIKTSDWSVLSKFEAHKHGVTSFDIHPSGKVLISVGKDYTLKCWDLSKCSCSYSMKLDKETRKVFWSQSGENYCLVKDSLQIISTETGEITGEIFLKDTCNAIFAKISNKLCSEGPDVLITCSNKGVISVFSVSGKQICSWDSSFGGRVKDICTFHENGSLQLAACSTNGKIGIWFLENIIKASISQPVSLDIKPSIQIVSSSRITCIRSSSF